MRRSLICHPISSPLFFGWQKGGGLALVHRFVDIMFQFVSHTWGRFKTTLQLGWDREYHLHTLRHHTYNKFDHEGRGGLVICDILLSHLGYKLTKKRWNCECAAYCQTVWCHYCLMKDFRVYRALKLVFRIVTLKRLRDERCISWEKMFFRWRISQPMQGTVFSGLGWKVGNHQWLNLFFCWFGVLNSKLVS